jgi:hypothetical protein
MTLRDGKVMVNVADTQNELRSGEVWLCPVTSKVSVEIGRGENHDRNLTYHNVVRRWVKLGDWNGKSETFSVPLAELPKGEYSLKDIDRLDVVVQSGVATKPGPILGVASTTCCTASTN